MDEYKVPLETPCVYHDANFLPFEEADLFYQQLLNDTPWEKTAKINRWVALYEEPENDLASDSTNSNAYKYRDNPQAHHQQQQQSKPFTETIKAISHKAETWYKEKNNANVHFNVCLLNFYQDGQQRIGWHCDREEIGRLTPIASISLGATRSFGIRAKQGLEKHTLELQHGSLVIMEPICQEQYVHSIPRQANVTEGRINLTFRCKQYGQDTLGEQEHERRDKWLQRMTDLPVGNLPSVYQPDDDQDGNGGCLVVFGDALSTTSQFEEESSLNRVVYTVRTNIGAEQYTVSEIWECISSESELRDRWVAIPRPWDAAGYVAICRTERPGNDEVSDLCESDSSASTAIVSKLLQLRSAHHLMQYHDHFDLHEIQEDVATIDGEQLYQFYKHRLVKGDVRIPNLQGPNKRSFRVTCDRIGGPHAFRAPQVEFEIGGALSEYYKDTCHPQMEDYDVQIRVDVVGNVVMVGTQLNVEEMARRHFTRFRNGVTIKCNLAYVMLRCANVQPGHLVVDPFCGGGTILLEAMEMTGKQVKCIGMDVSGKSARGARENARAENCPPGSCEIHCTDARALRKHLQDESVDSIVSNLPWGVMTGSKNVNDLQSLYEIFLRTAWYVLKDKGRIVMLVLRGLQLTRIVRKLSGRYRLLRCNVVRTTNNLPCIVVIEKIGVDTLNDAIKGQLAYMSQYVNVSSEMYHAIHMEDIAGGSEVPDRDDMP
ncbi:mRNA N1-methyladenine demethylase [Fistulifera solaris]|uniref:mRNA N1-methyladenine demethylase n=1 Tax=Fistulifera solaris TaxID=1519565 RepID=A0A1Z5JI97_FISSO|nr:mRNA N1-methyladenine demethylase [Fistulifera solaris]|eukprot:GAX13725.1 mRNA N1-methyladenine demethylase [Fistulifera solaris]